MRQVNVHEAKTHLSRLLQEVEAGAEIVIARGGRAVARLVPLGPPKGRRRLGRLSGRFTVPSDFDAPLPRRVLDAFEGRG